MCHGDRGTRRPNEQHEAVIDEERPWHVHGGHDRRPESIIAGIADNTHAMVERLSATTEMAASTISTASDKLISRVDETSGRVVGHLNVSGSQLVASMDHAAAGILDQLNVAGTEITARVGTTNTLCCTASR